MDAACDEDLRSELIERGRRRAAGYSWERAAALTDQAIGGVLDEGSRTRRIE